MGRKINAVNAAIHTDIEVIPVCGNIIEVLHIPFQKLIVLLCLHEKALGNAGIRGIEIVDRHTGFSLVPSPVHVTGNQEIHISRLVDIHNLNIVLHVSVSGIGIALLRETEDLHHLVSGGLILPESALADESHTVVLQIA